MVDTFTCDSCGKNNVPTDEKAVLLLKQVVTISPATQTTKAQKATSTIGMEICPDCKMYGIVKNNLVVTNGQQPERRFQWTPRDDLKNVYEWGKKKDVKPSGN